MVTSARVTRRYVLGALACLPFASSLRAQSGGAPVTVGLDGEFALAYSTSAQAIEFGMRCALDEINRNGGVLGGRPLALMTKDHRSIPARGLRNLQQFAEVPDLVAIFGGRFSPVIIEQLPHLQRHRIPFMAVWSSADEIIANGMRPNYAFRLSLRDSLAMPKLLGTAIGRGYQKVGLLLINSSWGRSNRVAAERFVSETKGIRIVDSVWYNWTETTLLAQYQRLLGAGAQCIVLVANDVAGATLVREIASLPQSARLPIISHWGVTGGQFFNQAGKSLQEVDMSVIQTFSFAKARPDVRNRFMSIARSVSKGQIKHYEAIESPVGVAHAYDAMHILARAINLAGTTNRETVRDALENVRDYRGLVRHYEAPFTATNHEALGPEDLLMARYRQDGFLEPMD